MNEPELVSVNPLLTVKSLSIMSVAHELIIIVALLLSSTAPVIVSVAGLAIVRVLLGEKVRSV
jgi:hypothetical protein